MPKESANKAIKFKGLIQNRPLKELTHQELVKAFSNTEYKLSNHAIGRLKHPRTKDLGFKTLNDIKQIFNKEVLEEASKETISYSYKGMKVIINQNTKKIITFSPI